MTIKRFRNESNRRFFFGVALALLLAGCHSTPEPQISAAPAALPKHAYAVRYAVDPARSSIVLQVYRAGPLARFGHNHVIRATHIEGMLYREHDILQSAVELRFPVAGLVIDAPADRAAAGADFPGTLSAAAIDGTREHMLGPQVLAAAQFPDVALRSIAVQGRWPALRLLVEVRLRGFVSQIELPVRMSEKENTLSADGAIKLSQVQMGMQPYSVLGGGLRVADTIAADFHIVAAKP